MTEQRRREICCELARQMGIPESKWPSRCRAESHHIDDDGFSEYCYTCGEAVHLLPQSPPDPFTNAADKDALVAWLAAQPSEMQMAFERDLLDSLCENDDGRTVALFWLTAPLEAITLAACKALGIETE